jgi:hypothetical protein
MRKLILLLLLPANTWAADIIQPWGDFMLSKYVGSTTPSYLNLSGDLPLRYGIDLDINFPILQDYLYFGCGTFAEANEYQFVQQTGKFWLGSQITTNFSIILMHHSKHNFDRGMDTIVPFPTTDSIEFHWNFGIKPKRK